MVLPAPNGEVLEALYQRKREYRTKIDAAETHGDLTEVHSLKIRMREVDSLIQERGGRPSGLPTLLSGCSRTRP
jgi:hypothetical protein